MNRITIAELQKLQDEVLKKLGVLEQKSVVLSKRIDALKAEQRKPKRSKK